MEYTFAAIKPDAVRNGKAQEIKLRIEQNGFAIVAQTRIQLTKERAEAFYAEHKGKPFFEGLIEFMTSGPIEALILAKKNAVAEWRKLMGPTNSFYARAENPTCLRAIYGTDGTQNAMHGSDSAASAQREMKFYFPDVDLPGDAPVAPPPAAVEWTFAMIKPDAVKKGKAPEIMHLIELNGFSIITKQKLQLTRVRAEEFYKEHAGKQFFPKLVEFMTSGPIWALVLSRRHAIKGWRELMGPTNSLVARETAPRSLRALYGTDGTQNATHGSDSPESAEREIKFYFPSLVLEPDANVRTEDLASEFITSKLQPALAKALTALAREKPSAEKFEAITFLANYLLANNPNKPRIITPDEWDPSMEEEDDEAEFAHAKLAAAESRMVDPGAPVYTSSVAPVAQAREYSGNGVASYSSASAASYKEEVYAAPAPAVVEEVVPVVVAKEVEVEAPAPVVAAVAEVAVKDDGADAAATKVQAAFRGHQARKEVDKMRADGSLATPEAEEETEAPTAEESKGMAAAGVPDVDAPVAEASEAAVVAVERARTPQPAAEEEEEPRESSKVAVSAEPSEAAPAAEPSEAAAPEAEPSEAAPAAEASEAAPAAEPSEAAPAAEASEAAAPEAQASEAAPAAEPSEAAAPEAEPSEAAPAAEASEAAPAAEPSEAAPAAEPSEAAVPAAEASEAAPAAEPSEAAPEAEPSEAAAPEAEPSEAAPAAEPSEPAPAAEPSEAAAPEAELSEAAPAAEASEAAPAAEPSEAAPAAEPSEAAAPEAEASEAAPAAESSEAAPAAEASEAAAPEAEASEAAPAAEPSEAAPAAEASEGAEPKAKATVGEEDEPADE